MSLSGILSPYFDLGVQARGRQIFASGGVHIQDSSSRHVHARVTGGQLYGITIRLDGVILHLQCDCPYFEDRGACKHLWATVLECVRRDALADVINIRNLKVDETLGNMASVDIFPELWRRPARPSIPVWQEYLEEVERRQKMDAARAAQAQAPRAGEILYVIDLVSSQTSGKLILELLHRTRKKSGDWTALKEFHISPEQAARLPDPVDVEIVSAILGAQDQFLYYQQTAYNGYRKSLSVRLARMVLPQAAEAARLFTREGDREHMKPVRWEEGEPWRLLLEVRQDDRDQWAITGKLRRGEDRMDLAEPALILDNGLLIARNAIWPFDDAGVFGWVEQLREVSKIPFPDRQRDDVMQRLLSQPTLPPMELDEPLRFTEQPVAPKLGLRVSRERTNWGEGAYIAQLLVDYGRGWIVAPASDRGWWFPEHRIYVPRDTAAESGAREVLQDLGMHFAGERWSFKPRALPRMVRELIQRGWHVEAEGKAFRRPGAAKVSVNSGIDWFELHGEVDYDGATASLPQLLAAARRGDSVVVLGDGSFGLLPEDWLERFAPLANLGLRHDDHLRFKQNQAGLLDAMLAAQPDVHVDEVFEKARERMMRFAGVQAVSQPAGFVGQLRHYQQEGLGWMEFLREFGFGGCLADDMGVGKTAQVLATLEGRRAAGHGPSLAVVPKSVIFNWRQEAARFTPQLRVLEHVGTARDESLIAEHDLVLTTYGTLLRDAAELTRFEFDYVVLDEAQAVKNASTASAKAVRLLRGKHRLALSGTPVENHLGELWSLFEFLNPGMLGEAKVLKVAGGLAQNPSEEARRLLSHALRPFILRRTKRQVARELPEKTEQTIYCELEGAQKKQYAELRDHFRSTLLGRVEKQGLGRSKMQVLEALLRLRQAACHPGLLDSARLDDPSAKLDVLLEQLTELREEGHKALVFSQFTSLLAIVRRRLDEAGIRYEYLDGATRNRQDHVEKFQNDPECGLFLISLKAGGLGLNLTAAEYVFLLDPWWNPAVEAQAVDRAHRIGQTKPVFAYRLIARDTVEEKVLELQKTKRDLADAILGEDNSLIRNLKREDLELLLS